MHRPFITILLCLMILVVVENTYAQVSISTNNIQPDSSAMLDIQSNSRGVLIPRMTSAQRLSISNAAEGLLVYDVDSHTFWFRQSDQWTELVSSYSGLRDQDADTRITVEATQDEDTIRMIAGGNEVLKTGGKALKMGSAGGSIYIGNQAGENTPSNREGNVFIGEAAGQNNLGSFSTGVGDSVLFLSTTTGRLTAFGYKAGMRSTDSLSVYFGREAGKAATGNRSTHVGVQAGLRDMGTSNVIIGTYAGNDSLTGSRNVFVGKSSGSANRSGSYNTFVGESSGLINDSGSQNSFVGYLAGYGNIEGTNNTFLGTQAGARNREGDRNTFLGAFSGGSASSDSIGSFNTFVGTSTGPNIATGERNVLIGDGTGFSLTSGSKNTFIGEDAGRSNVSGSNNTYLGRASGYFSLGSGNVFLGYNSGRNEQGSDKLYIANSSTTSPLIYGDFASERIKVNGNTHVVDSLAVGVAEQKAKFHVKDDGIEGQRTIVGVLESNASDRPSLLFSESPTSGIDNGMSIEYYGVGSFDNGRMYINKPGGEPVITFRNTGNVGIGTIQPDARLHVDSTVLFTGSVNQSSPAPLPVTGAGTRMLWYPDKAVFRAGYVDSDQWDQVNLGEYSVAMGFRPVAQGDYSVAMGRSVAATGVCAVSVGNFTFAPGDYSTATGFVSSTYGLASFATGYFTIANGFACTAVGVYNDPVAPSPQTEVTDSTPLFIVGNGNASDDRSNAMIVRKDGSVGVGTDTPDTRLHVDGEDNDGTNATLKITSGSQSILIDGNEIDAVSSDLYLQNNSADDVILSTGGGRVGLGTTTPEHPLHIESSGVGGQSTIGLVLESSTSKRPTILFSENASNIDINDGMSLEYDGAVSGNKFYVNGVGGVPRLTVESFGDVGIGTTNPTELLEVSESGNARIRITSTDNTTAAIDLVRASTSNTDWRIENDGNLKFFSGNNIDGGVTERYSFGPSIFRPSTDNVNQCGSSSFRWSAIYAANGTIQTSDIRYKTNVEPLSYGLEEVLRMRPVSYFWKDHSDDRPHVGLIAQEVQIIVPEAVHDSDPEHLGINYADLVPVLIMAVQDLNAKVESLEAEIESLTSGGD